MRIGRRPRHRNREQASADRRHDALRLAATEPETAPFVEIADIAHAMPEAISIDDLRQHRRLRPIVVRPRHHRPLHCDFADVAARQFEIVAPRRNRLVADANDLHAHALDWLADADAAALAGALPCLAEDFAAANRRDRQRFRRAVGCVHLHAVREQRSEALDGRRRHRRARRDDAPQRRQLDAVFDAVAADALNQGGRAEEIRDAEIADRVDDLGRIDAAGPRRVHFGNDRRHAERRRKQTKERKRRQIDFAGFDAVHPLQHFDLGGEDAVRIDNALGDAGAAAGEENRRRLIGLRRCHAKAALAACRAAAPDRASAPSNRDAARP